MATLRNKTTDSGVIILWSPHPDHDRPSTYQVTPAAVPFLETIGYSVPNPGDEAEIPWDVCRPLRVLGDLHFKSETPGEVDTGDIGDVDETYAHSLSSDQQERLREYIESHSQYRSASQSLTGELSSLPDTEEDDDDVEPNSGEGENEDSQNRDGQSNPLNINPKDVIVGQVVRISSSGNAMLKTDSGEEFNLGPLSEETVGEEIPVAVRNGTWGFCLEPRFWGPNYTDELFDHADGVSAASVRNLYTGGVDDQMQKEVEEFDVSTGEIITANVTHSSGKVTLGNYRNYVVEIVTEKPVPKGQLHVRIQGRRGPILIVEPTISPETRTDVADSIEVVVSHADDGGGYSLYENSLVYIPGDYISTGVRVHAAVTELGDQFMTASIPALPESDRPAIGEHVWVENGSLKAYPSIPVKLPSALPEVPTPLQLEIQSVATDHVVAGASWKLLPDFEVEDTLDAEQVGWFSDGTLYVRDGVPIQVDGFQADYGDERCIKLTGEGEHCLRGSIVSAGKANGAGSITDFVTGMEDGHRQLDSEDYDAAAASFSHAMDEAPEGDTGAWIDARACQAYTKIYSLIQGEHDGAPQNVIEEARGDLESVRPDAPKAATRCLNELRVFEHLADAKEAWSQGEAKERGVSSRKARAEAKREIRWAAKEGSSIIENTRTDQLNRETLHPTLISAFEDVADEFDGVHDAVSGFLEENSGFTKFVQWASLTEIEVSDTRDQFSLVEPFDPSREISEEFSGHRTRADEAATSEEDAITFREMKREYSHSRAIQQYIKYRANGVCEGCGEDAPFVDIHGEPYLELHHVDEFEMTGPDVPDRVVALCPTCHTHVHAGAEGQQLNCELRTKLNDGLGDLGTEPTRQR